MNRPLAELTRARILEFFREPGALFWVFGFPLLMAVVLGFAFRNKPAERLPVGLVESAGQERLSDALERDPNLAVRAFPSGAAAEEALRTGKVGLLVLLGSPVRYRFDPTQPEARASRLAADRALQRAAGVRDLVATRDDPVEEKGSRYIDFLIPGILGLNLMGTGMWGVGFAIVTARIKKTLKLLTATPMRRRDYLLCHILARLAFLVIEVPVILLFGTLVFGVPIRGSLLLLAAICLLAAMVFSGLGLLTTCRAQTLETASGLMNFVMIPMWLLSGSFFSAERFPAAAQPFIQALPLTAVNNLTRATMLGWATPLPAAAEVATLLAWGAASFALALRIFRWS